MYQQQNWALKLPKHALLLTREEHVAILKQCVAEAAL